jgi:hypothetical protein
VTKGNLWGFIQSRPYASVADIRRLFYMEVEDAASVPTSEGTFYIGLPPEAADLVRQLWHEGRIVLDTNPDVKVRVIQGVYPARVAMGRNGPAPAAPAAGTPAADGTPASASGTGGKGKRKRRRRRGGSSDGSGGSGGGSESQSIAPA